MNRSIIYPAELNFNYCFHYSSHNLFLYLFSISLIFLCLTLSVYISLPALRTLGGKIVMCQIICVITSYLLLILIAIYQDEFSFSECLMVGYITHYSLLCLFFWLNVMSFDIWLTFRTNAEVNWLRREKRILAKKEKKRFHYYTLYAFGVPFIIVLSTFLAQKLLPRENTMNPRVGHLKCFIEQTTSKNVFYFYPLAILLILNIIMFSATALKIFSETNKTKHLHRQADSKAIIRLKLEIRRFLIYVKLFVVMGVNWLSEPLSGIFGGLRCGWMLLDIINASLGLPVFVIFICKRRTLFLLSQKFFPKYQTFFQRKSLTGSSSSSTQPNDSRMQPLVERSLMSKNLSTALLLSPLEENTQA